jgi:hypothetical protein
MESFSIAPPGGGSRSRKPNDPLLGHCDVGAVAAGVRFHHRGLRFRQSSFRPIARVLRDGTFSAFGWLPLFWHAVVPSSFRLQVSPMTQDHPSKFLLIESGIQHDVPRRTLSTHPAQASDNAPAWHDRARFHRPTTPLTERGRPVGLGVNLGGTSTGPATGNRRGPHHERCRPHQICFAPRAGWLSVPIRRHPGEVSSLSRGVISQPLSDPLRASLRFLPRPLRPPRRLALWLASLAGGRRAYHVASREPSWVRPRLYAGGTSSAPDEFAASGPGHLPFWSKPISTFGLSLLTTRAAVHLGWPYHAPLVPDRRGAGSRDLGSRRGRHPTG